MYLLRKILAAGLLFLLSPIIAILLLIIYLRTGENPIFKQKRGIHAGKYIIIYKLKTLSRHKEHLRKTKENIFLKESLKSHISPFQAYLRRTGLDELPQLINIIKGEMNFIGPRPLPWDDVVFMEQNEPELHERRKAIKSKPGITGLWQLFGEKEKGIENLVELEEFYDKDNSFKLNAFILINTLPKVLFAKHQDSILGKQKLKLFKVEKAVSMFTK